VKSVGRRRKVCDGKRMLNRSGSLILTDSDTFDLLTHDPSTHCLLCSRECIDLFSYTAATVFNKLTYLLTQYMLQYTTEANVRSTQRTSH